MNCHPWIPTSHIISSCPKPYAMTINKEIAHKIISLPYSRRLLPLSHPNIHNLNSNPTLNFHYVSKPKPSFLHKILGLDFCNPQSFHRESGFNPSLNFTVSTQRVSSHTHHIIHFCNSSLTLKLGRRFITRSQYPNSWITHSYNGLGFHTNIINLPF